MKKRIAFISEHASPLAVLGGVDSGGQNVYVAELCLQLAAKGYLIDIFTRKENEDQQLVVEWCPAINVIHIVAGPVMLLPKEALLNYMDEFTSGMLTFMQDKKIQYDLLHANFFMSALVASSIKKLTGTPFIVTFHALGLVRKAHQKEMDTFPEERITIEKQIVQDADHIIAECPQDMEDLFVHYAADPLKVTIVPCGFNPVEFYPVAKSVAREFLGLNADSKIVLQLGRIVPRKGIDNVISAVGQMKDLQNVQLLVVGGQDDKPDFEKCPEFSRLRNHAIAEGVEEKVIFAGRKNRDLLKYYYSAADVFVSTPWYEPFGITPLESMACGTPVIGANVGGIKYSITNNHTGFLLPPHQPDKLAEKIEILLSDAELSRHMSENSLRRVHQMFTWEKVAEKLILVYDMIGASLSEGTTEIPVKSLPEAIIFREEKLYEKQVS